MREPSHGWAYRVLVLPRSTLTWAVPRMRGCDVPHCSHGTQARADPWMSGWGVSVSPRYSQVRASPRMGGCGVQRYSHGTLEWELTHVWVVVTRGVPIAPSSESCDFVVFVVPLGSPPLVVVFSIIPMALSSESQPMDVRLWPELFPLPLQARAVNLLFLLSSPFPLGSPPHGVTFQPSRFTFFSGIYPSPLLFSVTGAVRLPVLGLMAGIWGLPATGRLPALCGTQLPYTMLLLKLITLGSEGVKGFKF